MLKPFSSKIITDTGISMGDEGKGRLIYEIVEELKQTTGKPDPVAIVMKVNGGANSGHTAGGLKLNLLPAGVIEKSVPHLAIGSGVVADPRKFLWEGKPLEAKGFKIFSRLAIDERTMVSDLCHRLIDLACESYRVNILKQEPRGSTGRGITPSYQDEVGQWQIYYADFKQDRSLFAKKLAERADRACRTIQYVYQVDEETWNKFFETLTNAEKRANADIIAEGFFTEEEFDFYRFKGDKPFTLNLDLLTEVYWQAGTFLADSVCDVRNLSLKALSQDNYIIGEFGQSYWLDKRHGFPPNVTASHTFTPEIFQSAGIPVQPVHNMGCCKAYDTKVGTHLFITQMDDEHPLCKLLKKIEFGTSTGRQRMVGWFDAVEKGICLRYGGYQDIVINKLDALTYNGDWQGGELLICTGYRAPDGSIVNTVPRNDSFRAQLKPVYAQLPGWKEDISQIRSFKDLPANAKRYVAFAMKSIIDIATQDGNNIELPNLRYIGVGPNPSQIIRDIPDTKELIKLA